MIWQTLMRAFYYNTVIYYILINWILILSAVSCVSLRNNYLGKSDKNESVEEIGYNQLKSLEIQKHHADQRSDSILKSIIAKKNNRKPLSAYEVNQLYADFRQQLNYDKILSYILQSVNRHADSLSSKQQFAALSLLQSAAIYNRIYEKNTQIRRTLNRGDIGNNIPERILRKSRIFLYSPSIRKKVTKSKTGVTSFHTDRLINQLPKTNLAKAAFVSVYQKNDRLSNLLYKTFEMVGSRFFQREDESESEIPEITRNASLLLSEIQPFDILLVRSMNILANIFIPGYFGHASIWLGPVALKENHKSRSRNILRMRSLMTIHDKGMAESVTTGTRFCSLKECGKGETFVIMRYRNITPDQKKSVFENIMKQIHKNYDYNFDIESSDKINCTELVYLAYDFINWKERYYLGKYTLFPDDILLSVLNDKCFEIAAFLKDGKLIRHPDQKSIYSLIGK